MPGVLLSLSASLTKSKDNWWSINKKPPHSRINATLAIVREGHGEPMLASSLLFAVVSLFVWFLSWLCSSSVLSLLTSLIT